MTKVSKKQKRMNNLVLMVATIKALEENEPLTERKLVKNVIADCRQLRNSVIKEVKITLKNFCYIFCKKKVTFEKSAFKSRYHHFFVIKVGNIKPKSINFHY